jgi:hypothetical protein
MCGALPVLPQTFSWLGAEVVTQLYLYLRAKFNHLSFISFTNFDIKGSGFLNGSRD